MGATKTTQYTLKTIDFASVSRAMTHPARVRILELLEENFHFRSKDLIPNLELTKSTISFHIKKLYEVGLIQLEFQPNCYYLYLTDFGKEKVRELRKEKR